MLIYTDVSIFIINNNDCGLLNKTENLILIIMQN